RISYCTADKSHDKVFAYIAQNQLNENLECHAFLCSKRKMAQAVTLTVAQAFKIAFEFWQAAKEDSCRALRPLQKGFPPPVPSVPVSALPAAAAMGNLLDLGLEDPARSPLGSSSSSTQSPELGRSTFGPSPSVNNNVLWVRDSSSWPQLAQSRTNPHVLDTGLTAQDLQSAETLSPVDWNRMEPSTAEKEDLFMF
ncbi:ARH protein, partial [Sylvia atricapilla]|nr:ARH protein [Sylvia atricapilla]